MKKYFVLSVSLLSAAAVSSCREADLGFSEEEIARVQFEKAYTENFEKDYGKISAEQAWGFYSTSCGTRAGSESYHHYRIKQQDGWDSQKSFKCIDGKNYAVEHEVGSSIDWTEGHNGGTNVAKDDMKFIEANYQGPVQQPEKEYVRQYLISHPNQGDTSCALDSYIIYNLGYLNNSDNVGHMDELTFDDEHFQSYNGSTGYDYYVTNTDIDDPWYRDSQNSNEIHNHYRFYLIPADPANNFAGGLYLCFDYGGKEQDKFDGVYNDWVLKIQPGDMSRLHAARRVFCEDLGSTHDLDFNDVVYDYIQFTETLAEIKIYAVCGTLPVFFTYNGQKANTKIDANSDTWTETPEIHELLGRQTNQRVYYNSTAHGTFYVQCDDIMNFGIMREEVNGKPWHCIPSQQIGKIPYLIACPVGTEPQAEDQNISLKYTKFVGYPSNPYIKWWEIDPVTE